MHPQHVTTHVGMVAKLFRGEAVGNRATLEERKAEAPRFVKLNKVKGTIDVYGHWNFQDAADMPDGTVAIIPVNGVVTFEDQYCGPVGTATRTEVLRQLAQMDNIAGVVQVMTTPGGEATGLSSYAQAVEEFPKPIYTWVNGYCFSAGMHMAVKSDGIFVASEEDEVGSIGTMGTLVDIYPALEKEGFRIEDFYAESSPDKNKFFRDWREGNTEEIQRLLNESNESFLRTVREGRPGVSDEALTGRTFMAEQAQEVGLVDMVATLQQVVELVGHAATIQIQVQEEEPEAAPEGLTIQASKTKKMDSITKALNKMAEAQTGEVEQPEAAAAAAADPETQAQPEATEEAPEETTEQPEGEQPEEQPQSAAQPEAATAQAAKQTAAEITAEAEAIERRNAALREEIALSEQAKAAGLVNASSLSGGIGDPSIPGAGAPKEESTDPLERAAKQAGQLVAERLND